MTASHGSSLSEALLGNRGSIRGSAFLFEPDDCFGSQSTSVLDGVAEMPYLFVI